MSETPTIGRIVIYNSPDSVERPAIINAVRSHSAWVDLAVFGNDRLMFYRNVPPVGKVTEDHRPFWRWPTYSLSEEEPPGPAPGEYVEVDDPNDLPTVPSADDTLLAANAKLSVDLVYVMQKHRRGEVSGVTATNLADYLMAALEGFERTLRECANVNTPLPLLAREADADKEPLF